MNRLAMTILVLLCALISASGQAQTNEAADLLSKVDHLVYGTPDLQAGIDKVEELLGVRATPGGQHPGRGTRNALVALGPATYIEIIGIDPDQPEPEQPRPFGLDNLATPGILAWAAKGSDLERFWKDAAGHGITLGDVTSGSRRRPDGVLLAWRYTNPRTVVANGIVPFFIDWGATPHPAAGAAKGATLIGLRAEHPDPSRVQGILRQLGVDLPVTAGPKPAVIATINSPKGRVELR